MSEIGSGASEEKSFENVNGRTHGRMHDGRKVITIAHPEHSSSELKNTKLLFGLLLFFIVFPKTQQNTPHQELRGK